MKEESYTGEMMLKGRTNEIKIYEYLSQKPQVKIVRDVSSIKKYQESDIDFEVELDNGEIITYEVKSDKLVSMYSNVFLETERFYNNNAFHLMGWFWFSKADYLIIRNPTITDDYNTFIFNLFILRKVVRDYYIFHKMNALKNERMVYSDSNKMTRGLILKLEYIQNRFIKYNRSIEKLIIN